MSETHAPLEIGWEEWAPGDGLTISMEGATVAEVYGYDEFPCFDPEENEAAVSQFNARQKAYALKFAAAPDMYEANINTVTSLKHFIDNPSAWDHFDQSVSDRIRSVVKQAEASAAKARGEA